MCHRRDFERLLDLLRAHAPNVLVCLGDLLDASPASRFPNEDEWDLAEEYAAAGEHLRLARQACGPSLDRCVWLHGNHDANIREPNRLPKRLRSLCDWRASDNPLRAELEAGEWQEVPYSHSQAFRLGPVVFQHGAEHSSLAGRNLSQLYAPEWGLLVWGHTHRPTQPTEALLSPRVSLRRWHANAGCMVDWDRLNYAARANTSTWGRAAVVGECALGQKRHGGRLNWDARTVVFSRADEKWSG